MAPLVQQHADARQNIRQPRQSDDQNLFRSFPSPAIFLPICYCTAIFPGSHFPSCPRSLRNMVSYAVKRILRLRLIFAKQPYYGHDAAARRPSTKPHLLRFCMVQIPQSSVRRHSSVCFCTRAAALAATLGSLYRNPPSCAREKTRHAPATGKPRHAHARVRFRKNDGHSPAPNGHPPVRTGQQLCPNRSRWPKKAETGFFPPLRPQRLSCIISIIPRGRCKMAPRAAEALPIRRRQRRERFHPSAPVNTGSIASLSLPQRAAVALTHRQNFYC